jgi:hypothetical protein
MLTRTAANAARDTGMMASPYGATISGVAILRHRF